jgi:acyl carrier protein
MSTNKLLAEDSVAELRETLKRCPAGTLDSLMTFRETADVAALNQFLIGVLKRHVESEYQSLLDGDRKGLSFIDDLGIDSMTMMEVVMMVEECLDIRIENEDLMKIRTYGDLDGYVTALLKLDA